MELYTRSGRPYIAASSQDRLQRIILTSAKMYRVKLRIKKKKCGVLVNISKYGGSYGYLLPHSQLSCGTTLSGTL